MTEPLLAQVLQLERADVVARSSHAIEVAVIDSGIDATHPDLAGRVVRAVRVDDGQIVEADPTANNDVLGHGTAVAGIVAGIAPGARLIDVRVLHADSLGVGDDLLAGLRLAIRSGWPVLNLSLAAPPRLAAALAPLCERAFYQDQIVVAARRNFPMTDEGLPAEFAACLGVDAGTHIEMLGLRYRSRQSIEYETAGDAVRVAARGGGYTTMTGSSFATPVVSGLCAMILGAFPALRAVEVRSILMAWGSDDASQRSRKEVRT